MNRRQTGSRKEAEAAEYLEEQGYRILERNFHVRSSEIDLIAEKDDLLAFVEVKMRRSEKFGLPEEAVDQRKQSRIIAAAEIYLQSHPHPTHDIRFDIIAISGKEREQTIRHIEDAFRRS